MKKIAFITREHFKKTKSDLFLINLLSEYYDVNVFYRREYDDYLDFNQVHSFKPEIVLFFAKLPSFSKHLRYISLSIDILIIPMYDGFNHSYISRSYFKRIAIKFLSIKFITFSHKLHEYLTKFNICSYYFKYFPQKKYITYQNYKYDPPYTFLLWQRNNIITPNYIINKIPEFYIDKIIIKKDIDKNSIISNNKLVEYTDKYWYTEKELDSLLLTVDFFIAPRLQEGIGMSFLNALNLGLPIVAWNDSTMNEYIVDNENGILLSSDDNPTIIPSPFCLSSKISRLNDAYRKLWSKGRNEIRMIIDSL